MYLSIGSVFKLISRRPCFSDILALRLILYCNYPLHIIPSPTCEVMVFCFFLSVLTILGPYRTSSRCSAEVVRRAPLLSGSSKICPENLDQPNHRHHSEIPEAQISIQKKMKKKRIISMTAVFSFLCFYDILD